MMKIKILKNKEELNNLAPLEITHLLWGTKSIPRTYFYIGFIPEDGFYVRMVCEEKDPLRTYTEDFDPVYRDSAMEAFFQFIPEQEVYLNFEVNANGALLAAYGPSRMYRSYFSKEDMAMFQCRTEIEEDRWTASIRIPLSVLEHIYGALSFKAGDTISCNFYKISETKDVEHYAAYAPILSSTPSFHLPEYFASAILE